MGCLQLCRRDCGSEAQGCEGCHRRFVGCCGGTVEEKRIFQARRRFEFEVEKETSNGSPQGCEPFHEGAVCVQSEACIEDSEGFAHEKVQGDGQLRRQSVSIKRAVNRFKSWWAASPGLRSMCTDR